MADETDTVMERDEPRVATVDPRPFPASPRISWAAIFGGAVAALGLWLLLYAFGLAVGLSSMDPNDPHSARGSGIFTGVWSGVSPLIALFVGGLVAARLAGVFLRGYGALHGLVMWGLVTISGALMVFTIVSSLVTGAAKVGGSVVRGGGAALKGMASAAGIGAGGAQDLGLDWDEMLAPVNQRLRSEGKPPVMANDIKNAAKDTMQASLRRGRFDRSQFEAALAQNTALSRADAQDLSQRVEAQFEGSLQEAKQSATSGALKAADATGKAFWGVFAALALGLLAALGGGILGVPRVRVVREPEPGPRPVRTEPAPRGPIVPPRQAYRRT
jgi:hypothetical protein